jgi:hypothetical protein
MAGTSCKACCDVTFNSLLPLLCTHTCCNCLQRTAGEHERLHQDYTAKMEDFRKRNKGKFGKSLMIPGMGLAQAALFISQFSAVATLAKDKVRWHTCI